MLLCEISQTHKNTILFYGEGTLVRLDEVIPQYKNVLVFTDKNGFSLCGAADYFGKVAEGLGDNTRIHYFSYSGKALPLEDIELIFSEVRNVTGVDLIIAIGGGTVIDLAKIIAIAYSNQCSQVSDILAQRELQNTLDLVFIPTTAGTGSEATSFAVVYREKVKLSIDNPSVLPDYVVLDPHLLQSLPEAILNSVILDALAQAVESVWARGATDESRRYARESIQHIRQHYNSAATVQRLSRLLWASHLAGKAINISRTTLSHSISYPITAHFGVPHGIAVFLTLPAVTQFNYEATGETLQAGLDMTHIQDSFAILFDAFEVRTIADLVAQLKAVMAQFKLSLRLRDHGIHHGALPFLASNGLTQGRSDNNPRKADEHIILAMLEALF